MGLWASAATIAVLLFVGVGVPEAVRAPLTYLLGLLLLAIGVRQSYAKNTAEAELIKQYDFMVDEDVPRAIAAEHDVGGLEHFGEQPKLGRCSASAVVALDFDRGNLRDTASHCSTSRNCRPNRHPPRTVPGSGDGD